MRFSCLLHTYVPNIKTQTPTKAAGYTKRGQSSQSQKQIAFLSDINDRFYRMAEQNVCDPKPATDCTANDTLIVYFPVTHKNSKDPIIQNF